MGENYQKELDKILNTIENEKTLPKLLLHVCCAPCSSYVLEYLSRYFSITVFFHNPNIYPKEEYIKRIGEAKRFLKEINYENPVNFIEAEYNPKEFLDIAKGKENLKEGGERCYLCYKLRLEKTALFAKENNFDYFTTTLSISPHKNAVWINKIGLESEKIYGVKFLLSDFKKKNGYKRSIELSKQYGLYRQDYCGCIFSKREK